MAVTLNIPKEEFKRGDTFYLPTHRLVPAGDNNSRFAPPSSEDYENLKDQIRKQGQISAVQVTPTPGRDMFRIDDGNQRYQIICELNEEDGKNRTVKCELYLGDRKEGFLRSISANVRCGISHMDHAKACRTLMFEFGMTQAEIAEVYGNGKTDGWVSQHMTLLTLPHAVKMDVHEGRIEYTAALKLAAEMRRGETEQGIATIADVAKQTAKVAAAAKPQPRNAKPKAVKVTPAIIGQAIRQHKSETAPQIEGPAKFGIKHPFSDLREYWQECIRENPHSAKSRIFQAQIDYLNGTIGASDLDNIADAATGIGPTPHINTKVVPVHSTAIN